MSESNRDDNHVCSFIKCRDIAQRPSLPGPPVRIGRGRGGRVEGRSTHPASCPSPLLSLCEFGWALQAREMRGSVCSAEHVFWSARVHGMRERALRGTVPSRTTPWGSQCGVEMRPFGSFPVLPSRLSCSGTAYAPPAARAPQRDLPGVPGLVSDLACGGRPSWGLPWAGRARPCRALPGADI